MVDLVRLDRASTLLLWEIENKGKVLHEGVAGEAARFKVNAAAEYLDFAPEYDRAAENFRKRLAATGGSFGR